jgi:mycofactocin system glycosyltransferase
VTAPIPAGLRVEPDLDTVELDADVLLGGSPRRVMRLSAAGRMAWAELRHGPVRSVASGVLARRLTDAGLAHPRPDTSTALDVTVVIPVRDRIELLERCLSAIGDHPVVVVDDGSGDPAAVAAVARGHGARLVRHDRSRGPAAARNSGLAGVTSALVAFLDSDCIAPEGWLAGLAGHFADPLVAAVAPRIVTTASGTSRYLDAVSVLDLGSRAALVRSGSRVAYVPTAALLVRRVALDAVTRAGQVFDPALRYGEDVDLVWRLDAAGWRVRYDPSVEVGHVEPAGWRDRATRRFRYGTSAAPLSRRHAGALAPLRLQLWPGVTVAALLLRRPAVAAAAAAVGCVATRRAVAGSGVAELSATRLTGAAVGHTVAGVGRYVTQLGAPLALAAIAARRGRLTLAALVVGPPLWDGITSRSGVSPVRFAAGRIADDIAYGAGVGAGAIRHRTAEPLLPVVVPSRRGSRGAH